MILLLIFTKGKWNLTWNKQINFNTRFPLFVPQKKFTSLSMRLSPSKNRWKLKVPHSSIKSPPPLSSWEEDFMYMYLNRIDITLRINEKYFILWFIAQMMLTGRNSSLPINFSIVEEVLGILVSYNSPIYRSKLNQSV